MAMDDWPRHNVQTRPFDGGRLDIYERADRLVTGPCMSLYVGDVEVMRIDLPEQPAGEAHEHWWGMLDRPRLYYPRHWPRDLIMDLACSNIVEHGEAAARLAGLPAPSRADLEAVAEWARLRLS